jgi:5-methylcytosine-specific restriction protein A
VVVLLKNAPRSSVNQNTRVQDIVRVQPLLDRLQRVGKQFGALAVIPGPVVTTERMMVRDRPACVDHCFRRGSREEFAGKAREVLADRAEFMRKRVADFGALLPIQTIDLGSNARLPGDYVAGHALGVSYALNALPTEATLRTDLQNVVRAYRALTFRGGIEGDVEPQAELEDEFKIPAQATVIETRKYAFHRKVERNRTAAKQAKKFHGTICQACDFDFEKRYGAIGKGFIEAHHLKPIATLEEGVAVTYDVAADFAVLCANCHRMIHKSDNPSDLIKFRELVRSNKS